MKFGILKSKIEEKLLESYIKQNFKNEIKHFKKLVLEDKTISSIFYSSHFYEYIYIFFVVIY